MIGVGGILAREKAVLHVAIRTLVGKNIAQIDLDKGLRTAQSSALLAMGSWPFGGVIARAPRPRRRPLRGSKMK